VMAWLSTISPHGGLCSCSAESTGEAKEDREEPPLPLKSEVAPVDSIEERPCWCSTSRCSLL
jgi:hypothetical protein